MTLKYQTLTGMHDILPEDQVYFKKIHNDTNEKGVAKREKF